MVAVEKLNVSGVRHEKIKKFYEVLNVFRVKFCLSDVTAFSGSKDDALWEGDSMLFLNWCRYVFWRFGI